ncbi:4-alpha-glucanotransferase [Arachnia propionica]|uniref:4-alpha-glucanotransferase n=1 Tax=Arachnia propionica TaxID=1750 RepID=A0A3P1WQE8_9ACTN|nr:4-alpha-glucanotransferase [Arachnia propionica]RRD48491.1 4-alpha-glucanotransferase [Arachnia propionica]
MTTLSSDLQQLAERVGIAREFWDWKGNHTLIAADTIVAVLAAMGIDASSDDACRAALAALDDEAWLRVLPPCTVVEEGVEVVVDVHVPAGTGVEVRLVTEGGRVHPGWQIDNWVPDREVRGAWRGEASFSFGADLPLGYHRLEAESVEGHFEASVVVAPTFVGFPERMRDSRVWGYACQLYSVTSKRSWGMGDFVDLADLATWAGGEQGAGFVLVNPLHAAQPVAPIEPSPYLPASRRFLSPLYIRPEGIPEFTELSRDSVAELKRLRKSVRGDGTTIDRDSIWAAKKEALWQVFRAQRRAARQLAFATFRRHAGPELRDFATWSALCEVHGVDWRSWPEELRDPRSEATLAFAADNAERVEFFEWLQWTAQQQLGAAQAAADEAGMTVGVLADLAVGVSRASAETWLMRDVYASGVTVGAPPDQYNQAGQDWGQPPWNPRRLEELAYAPFKEMVRGALRGVGGLRIDHIIGLFRLWWVPEGLGPAGGTYVRYDHDAIVGILALEAHRAQALVVGEDLGTVEPWVRRYLARRGILGTGVLWWEYDEAGNLLDPDHWREYCMASVTTHDLPPTQGYLKGGHVELRHELGILTEPLAEELVHARRERDMWAARLVEYGVLAPEHAEDTAEIMLALHRYLGLTRSRVLVAALADAVGELRTQNQPGTMNEYPNWRVPLGDASGERIRLEEIFEADLPTRLAEVLNVGAEGQREPAPPAAGSHSE